MSIETHIPQNGEVELRRILEIYKDSPLFDWETYSLFEVSEFPEAIEARNAKKRAFLDGSLYNPALSCPALESEDGNRLLFAAEHAALDLMKDSVALDYDNDRETALYDKLRLQYLEVAMLQIGRRLAVENISAEERAKLVDLFNLANDEVHGGIEEDRFWGLINGVRENAERVIQMPDVPKRVYYAAEYLLENITFDNTVPTKAPIAIPKEKLAQMKSLLEEEMADILSCVPEGKDEITIDELAEIFVKAHQLRHTGWRTQIDEGKSQIDSRQSEKITHIGRDRNKLPSSKAVKKLIVHENGVHVERRKQGDVFDDPLLGGTGLPDYLTAEEGLGVALEQILDEKTSERGSQYYFGIGLARGLDGKKRDFRGVFELDWRRRVIEEYIESPDEFKDRVIEEAKTDAYDYTCVRIFRGTPCDIPGIVYTKDLAYYVGSQKMLEHLVELLSQAPEASKNAFGRLFKAKFDPTNELHNRILDKALERIT